VLPDFFDERSVEAVQALAAAYAAPAFPPRIQRTGRYSVVEKVTVVQRRPRWPKGRLSGVTVAPSAI
jgi:hypothetical protein